MIYKKVADVIDRWSIVKLKVERIGSPDYHDELVELTKEIVAIREHFPQYDIDQWCNFMYEINDYIWQMEHGLKSGKEVLKNSFYIMDEINKETLSKIGVISIMVRNFNNLRISFKNVMARLTNGTQEVKKDHLSE